jgi:hypothetical protein
LLKEFKTFWKKSYNLYTELSLEELTQEYVLAFNNNEKLLSHNGTVPAIHTYSSYDVLDITAEMSRFELLLQCAEEYNTQKGQEIKLDFDELYYTNSELLEDTSKIKDLKFISPDTITIDLRTETTLIFSSENINLKINNKISAIKEKKLRRLNVSEAKLNLV